MPLDLDFLPPPGSVKNLTGLDEDEEDDNPLKKRKIEEEPTTAEALDLSFLPPPAAIDLEKRSPEKPAISIKDALKPILDTSRRAAPAVADITEDVPGSTTLKYLKELYGPKAPLLKPAITAKDAGDDILNRVTQAFKPAPERSSAMYFNKLDPNTIVRGADESIIVAPGTKTKRLLSPQERIDLGINMEVKRLKEKATFEQRAQAFTNNFTRLSPPGILLRSVAGNEILEEDKTLQKAFPKTSFAGSVAGDIWTTVSGIKILNPHLASVVPTVAKSVPMLEELYPTASRVMGGVFKDMLLGAGIGVTKESLEQAGTRDLKMSKIGAHAVESALAFAPFGVVPYTKIGIEGGVTGAVKRGAAAAAVVGGSSAIIPLLKKGKISEDDLVNVAVNSIVAGVLQGQNAKDISEAYKRAEVDSFLFRQTLIKVQNTSPNLTENEAKAVASFAINGLGREQPALVQRLEKIINPIADLLGKLKAKGLIEPSQPTPGAAPAGTLEVPPTINAAGGRIAPVDIKPENEPALPEIKERGLNYDILLEKGNLSDNFIFSPETTTEDYRAKQMDGKQVYTVEEIEAQAKKEFVARDTGLMKKEFLYDAGRKADELPLIETPLGHVDFDNLKALNDKIGNPKADLVFEKFASTLGKYGFTAARHGGDEFVIVLNPIKKGGVNPVDVFMRMYDMQQELGEIEVYLDDTNEVVHKGLTISGGYGVKDGKTSALEAAYKVGKQAKSEGKNGIILTKAFLDAYNKHEGTKYEWPFETETVKIGYGLPRPIPKSALVNPPEGESAGPLRQEQQAAPAKSREVTPPKTPGPDPTASYTPLLEEIVPQEKKIAGEGKLDLSFLPPPENKPDMDTISYDTVLRAMKTGDETFSLGGLYHQFKKPKSLPVIIKGINANGEVEGAYMHKGGMLSPALFDKDELKPIEVTPEMREIVNRVFGLSLDIQPEGDILKVEDPNAGTQTERTEPRAQGAGTVGPRSGEPLEGEPPQTLPGVEEGGETPSGAPKRAEPDRGGLPEGKGAAGSAGAGPGGGRADRAGTGERAVGISPGGGRSAGQRELDRKSALEKSKNYHITAVDHLGEGTPAEKYQNNIEAIKTLKLIEFEGRPPTPAEMAILVRYVGWGGMPQVFDEYNDKFDKKFKELEQLLTPEEYESARASTPNAHYTSPEVINAIYSALNRMGFMDGRILEPAAGAGNFVGLMPLDIINNSRVTMVELDSITGRIAKNLYQEEDVRIQGYETVKVPDNYFDLAISNVPFGNFPVHDPAYAKIGLARSIHNYFFAKSIDKIRPGGLVAFITSRYTMDAEDTRLRKYLSERADLVGAIRLPNTAFKKNAGTEVVTDIIILQKRETWEKPKDESWIETQDKTLKGETYALNNYFVQHKDMMLGRPSMEGTQYRSGEFTLEPTGDLTQQLAEAITKLQSDIYRPRTVAESAAKDVSVPAPEFVKEGGLFIENGKVYKKNGDVGEDHHGLSVPHLQSFLKLRDQLRTTMANQLYGNEDKITGDQKQLNKVYDDFTVLHGPINGKRNDVFAVDPDYPMMLALERKNKDTGRFEKADIFSKRVLQPDAKIESVETSQEALFVSLNETGKINFQRMEALTGKSQADLVADLRGSLYKNPETSEYETVDEYLSGNVRKKLEVAEGAAKNDPQYRENVQALKEVQPKDLMPAEIKARLGSPWIPAEYIDQFAANLFNLEVESSIQTVYIPQSSTWAVDERHNRWKLSDNIGNTKTWGTERYPAVNIISDTLNHKLPTVMDRAGDKSVVNKAETEAARDKQEKIKERFQQWVLEDPKRATDLAAIYNRELNNIVLRTYDGKHLTLPGANRLIFEKLRKHQKNGIFRGLQGRNVLLAHAVGAGKTWVMAGIAMETKRIGLFKKTVITVPKNRLKATAAEFLQMYPSANLLVADTTDLAEANRKVFKSRIATGDWDAVIISKDSFGKIKMSNETIQKFIDDIIEEFEQAIENARMLDSKRGMSVKELEKAKKRIEAKLKGMMKDEKKDDGLSFEELGVDQIIVDEAQNYKSLFLVTQMTRVKGIPTSAADLAFDMFMKTEYLNRMNKGKGIVFATGTPVTNTIAEIYIMQRYLQNQALKDYGIENFDAWAHTFGETVTGFELDTTGKGFRPVSRFAKFSNIPELLNIFFQVADVQTAKMLNLPVPKVRGGHPQPAIAKASPSLLAYIDILMKRAEKVRSGAVDKTVDNMLKISTDGRKAAMDMRLVSPTAKDYPDSKTNLLVEKIVDIFKANTKTRSVQLVFSDLGTPSSTGGFSIYNDVKNKLMAKGIPKDQIGFIHDAKTDDARKVLEDKINSGVIRVLLGSTPKMGLGMNVQERLVALHHLDVPWRPDWLEQRNGRILRQGNVVHDEVQIYNYGTEKSFDAFMWQTVERKAKFIAQVMSGEISAREVEDVDDVVLNFAQMKAITTGDPTILEKVELDAKIARTQSLQTTHLNNQHMAHMEIAALPDKIKSLDNTLEELEADLGVISKYDTKNFKITIGGLEITERVRAGEKIMLMAKQHHVEGKIGDDFHIGEFKGLPLFLHPAGVVGNPDRLHIQGRAFRYEAFISDSPDGTIRSLDYQSGKETIEGKIKAYQETRTNLEKKLKELKEEIKKPFADEAELKKMIARQQELEKKLDMTKGESTVGSGEEERPDPSDEEEPSGGAAMRAPGGSGAASRAPSTKPQPGQGDDVPAGAEGEKEAPKNPVWPGAPNDFVPHIEMPELVRLWRQIMGDLPTLRKLRRNLGYFQGARGEKLARITLDLSIFKNPVEATKLLSHEIGHWVDWLSEHILARGNILGRLKSLAGYRRTLIDPLPSANDALNPLDRKKIMMKATKEALSRTDYTLAQYIKNPQIRVAMKGMIKETYDEMIKAEIKRKGLVTKEQVVAELKAVTRYWHPFEPGKDPKYDAYRFSSKELYAEALSMLFNEPLRLKEMAPTFYKVFWDNLEKKPEIHRALLELDEMLASENPLIQEQRAQDMRLMLEKGEKLWFQKRKERYIKTKRVWLRLKDEFIDKDAKIMEDIARVSKTHKINPEDNPKYYMDAHTNIGGVLHNLIEDIETNITDPIRHLGVTEYDLGVYSLLRRIMGERTQIANPLGFNTMTAPKDLKFLLSKFNESTQAKFENSMNEMSKITRAVNQEYKAEGLATPEAAEIILKNDVYAPFMFLDYIQDYISSGIIKQVGGLGEIANPFTAWVMKMMAMKRAIYRERIRKKVVNFYKEFLPDEIKEAEYKVIGMSGETPLREVLKKDGFGIIEIHNDGKKIAYYVDPYIADSVNYQPYSHTSAVLEIIRWSNRTWFKPIQTGMNLRYQTVNLLFRDFPRQWKNTPGLSFYGALKRYFESARDAASSVWWHKATPVIREMRELGILGMTYNDLIKGMPEEETQLEFLTRRYGIGPQRKRYRQGIFSAILNLIGSLGEFEEVWPKVVGYKFRNQAPLHPRPLKRGEMERIIHEVQVYSGSPLFSRRGSGFRWYNEIYPYSNAKKEGIRGDIEAGFSDPNTRGGYWWKTAAIHLLPTLIKWLAAMGLFGYMGKKIMDGQTEHTKTNYYVIPVGITDNNQSVAITIPQEDMGGMISGLFWKLLNRDKDFLTSAQQVVGFVIGQKPGTAVLMEMMSATMAYVVGQPHYDYYHGKTILTRDEQLVGGWPAARAMGRWYLDKLGLSVKWGLRDKAGDTPLITVVKYSPFVNFFIRITDRGYKEQKRKNMMPRLERQADRRIHRREMMGR